MSLRTWVVRATTLAAVTVTLLGATTVVSTPAHAGQVGVTVSITGAGTVTVVEGTPADGASGVCDATANVLDPGATTTCPRIRTEAPFEAWMWLRPTPYADGSGPWTVDVWRGCDDVRARNGVVECGVHSGAFSSDERAPSIRFIDKTWPRMTSVTSVVSTTVDRTATFRFEANEPATFQCRFDDEAAFAPCSSPLTRTFATDGTQYLTVFATDLSGNTGLEDHANAALVDTRLTATPPALSSSRQATFGFATGGGDGFRCELDGVVSGCGSVRQVTWTFGELAEGQHTLRVAARKGDAVDPVPAVHTWTVDTTAPETTIEQAATEGRDARFEVAAPGAVLLECRLTRDGVPAAWTPCEAPVSFTGLSDAAYVVEVRGTDAAGNVDPTPASHAWTVRATPDTTAPQTVLTSGPAAGSFVLSDRATLGFAASEAVASWRCTLDGAARPCSGRSIALTRLAAGTHRFTVAAVDAAGNVDATPAVRTWTVPLTSGALRHGKGWKQQRKASAWGGSVAVANRRGAVLSTRVSGARSLALVATTGKGLGSVKVYAGRRLLRTVRLTSRSTTSRRVLPVVTSAKPFTGTVRIVVAGSKQVRIEGLGVAS